MDLGAAGRGRLEGTLFYLPTIVHFAQGCSRSVAQNLFIAISTFAYRLGEWRLEYDTSTLT